MPAAFSFQAFSSVCCYLLLRCWVPAALSRTAVGLLLSAVCCLLLSAYCLRVTYLSPAAAACSLLTARHAPWAREHLRSESLTIHAPAACAARPLFWCGVGFSFCHLPPCGGCSTGCCSRDSAGDAIGLFVKVCSIGTCERAHLVGEGWREGHTKCVRF